MSAHVLNCIPIYSYNCLSVSRNASCQWRSVLLKISQTRLHTDITKARQLSNGSSSSCNFMLRNIGCNKYTQRQFSRLMRKNSSRQSLQREARTFATYLSRSFGGQGNDLLKLYNNGGVRWFGTSRVLQQMDTDENRDDKKDDQEQDSEDSKMPLAARFALMTWLGFLFYVIFRLQGGEENSTYQYISWNEFLYDMLAKGEVEEMIVRPEAEMVFIKLHEGAVIKGKRVGAEVFTMKIIDPYKFDDKLRRAEAELGIRPEQGVPISYQRESSWGPILLVIIVAAALFFLFKNVVKVKLPNPTDMFAKERKAKFVRVDKMYKNGRGVNFKDIAGLHEAKVEVMEFIDFLKRPEKYQELGGKIPRGALLLGPPGCGKTLLAKAVATEAEVPFLAMAGSEFVEMLGGLGAARVRDLFKEARKNAPCIIYIDEIDAVGRKRQGSGEGGEEEHTLNQLLVEMDGMSTTQGVIMLGSTNRPDVLDKALLRPGRFDRHILIDFPSLAERKEIFEVYLGHLRLKHPVPAYSERLAQLSPGMNGADIANICNEAALHAAREGKKVVDMPDFDYAVERVVAGVAKKSRVLSEQEKKVVAYHEAGHALVSWLLKHTDALLRVSIVPRTSSALGFAQYLPDDRKLWSREELFEKMCMMLGGRVSESITFNKVTSGAHDDLKKVTKTAYAQVRELGMNDHIGQMAFGAQSDFAMKPYSRHLAHLIDNESRNLVAKAYKTTETLLLQNKGKLRVVAEALLEKETLTYKDMEQLIGPPTFSKFTFSDPILWDVSPPSTQTTPPSQGGSA